MHRDTLIKLFLISVFSKISSNNLESWISSRDDICEGVVGDIFPN